MGYVTSLQHALPCNKTFIKFDVFRDNELCLLIAPGGRGGFPTAG